MIFDAFASRSLSLENPNTPLTGDQLLDWMAASGQSIDVNPDSAMRLTAV
jgi:hypothetical protein